MEKLIKIMVAIVFISCIYTVYLSISIYFNLPIVQKSYTTKAGTCFWEDSLVKRPEGV